MRCFVTAGPTWEPLDQARRLTNFSTGRLGGELANALLLSGLEVELFLSETSVWRASLAALQVHSFSTTDSLAAAIKARARTDAVAFFHAAAVSDFTGGPMCRRDSNGTLIPVGEGKPSTRSGSLWVELKPTPKILPQLRDWFPQGRLTGWKFEVDGGMDGALARAGEQLRSARTDLCVVNGPAWGEGFGLLDRDGRLSRYASRAELISVLVSRLDSAPESMREPVG